MVDNHDLVVDCRDGRPMLLSGRPSLIELTIGGRALGFWSGSKHQGRLWQGFSMLGEIMAWPPNAWIERGTPSPSCPLVFQGDRFHSSFSTIKGCTFLQRNNKIYMILPWKACMLLSLWETLGVRPRFDRSVRFLGCEARGVRGSFYPIYPFSYPFHILRPTISTSFLL